MKCLVGSKAAKHWFPDFPREPRDEDWWINYDSPAKEKGIEYKDVRPYPNLLKFLESTKDEIASPEQLYALKVSHSFWAKSFWAKTMADILFFQRKGVPLDEKLVKSLYKDWEIVHGKKKAYFDVPNEEFFTKSVDRKYVHDDIHRAIAYYDEPMYMKIKEDQSKALTSNKLFNQLEYGDKLKTVREEVYTTALERFLIPNPDYSPQMAYEEALKLLICSMTKGSFSIFIVANFMQLCKMDIDYYEKFKYNEHKCRRIKDDARRA